MGGSALTSDSSSFAEDARRRLGIDTTEQVTAHPLYGAVFEKPLEWSCNRCYFKD